MRCLSPVSMTNLLCSSESWPRSIKPKRVILGFIMLMTLSIFCQAFVWLCLVVILFLFYYPPLSLSLKLPFSIPYLCLFFRHSCGCLSLLLSTCVFHSLYPSLFLIIFPFVSLHISFPLLLSYSHHVSPQCL